MADRYWVGGTASWDATAGSKWALTSGGAGGQAVPTAADDVFFSAASTGTCTISGTRVCRSLDCTGFTATLTFAASAICNIGTSSKPASNVALKLVAGMTCNGASGATWNFISTTTGSTVAWAGKPSASAWNVNFNGSGGGWTLTDSMIPWVWGLFAGTLDTNGQTVNCHLFQCTGATTRALTLGASAVDASDTNLTSWDVSGSGFTLNAGTSTITTHAFVAGTQTSFNGGGKTYYSVVLEGLGIHQIGDSNTFTNLTRTAGSGATVDHAADLRLWANQTITGTLTLTGYARNKRLRVRQINGTEYVTQRTLTAAAVSITNTDFSDIIGAGAAAPFSGTSVGDMTHNSGITFTTPVTRYWVGNGGNWSDAANHWASTSGGTAGIDNYPIAQDTARFDANSFSSGSQTVTNDVIIFCGSDWTGVSNTPTYNLQWGLCLGSLTLVTEMNLTTIGWYFYFTRSGSTFTTAGKSFTCWPVVYMIPTGTVTLQDDLTCTAFFIGLQGTWVLTNRTVTMSSWLSDYVGLTRGFTIGNATLNITGSTGLFYFGNRSDSALSINNGSTSTINITDTSNGLGNEFKWIDGNGKTYGVLNIAPGGTLAVLINQSNTWEAINCGGGYKNMQIVTGTTQTIIGALNLKGVSGAGNFPALVLADGGLLHYWRMGENSGHFADSKGTDASTSEGSTVGYGRPGAVIDTGKATYFDGSANAYAETASSTYVLGNTLTIEVWVKPDVGSLATRRTIYSHNDVAGGPELEIGTGNGMTKAVTIIIPGVFVAAANNCLADGVWNHIVYTRSGAGATHAIYVNGSHFTLATNLTNSFVDGAAAKQIGRRSAAIPQNFLGVMGELAVYNTAMSAATVLARFEAVMKQVNLRCDTLGSQGTISAGAGAVIRVEGASVRDSIGSGGAVFRAVNSDDRGNDTGWTFVTTQMASGNTKGGRQARQAVQRAAVI